MKKLVGLIVCFLMMRLNGADSAVKLFLYNSLTIHGSAWYVEKSALKPLVTLVGCGVLSVGISKILWHQWEQTVHNKKKLLHNLKPYKWAAATELFKSVNDKQVLSAAASDPAIIKLLPIHLSDSSKITNHSTLIFERVTYLRSNFWELVKIDSEDDEFRILAAQFHLSYKFVPTVKKMWNEMKKKEPDAQQKVGQEVQKDSMLATDHEWELQPYAWHQNHIQHGLASLGLSNAGTPENVHYIHEKTDIWEEAQKHARVTIGEEDKNQLGIVQNLNLSDEKGTVLYIKNSYLKYKKDALEKVSLDCAFQSVEHTSFAERWTCPWYLYPLARVVYGKKIACKPKISSFHESHCQGVREKVEVSTIDLDRDANAQSGAADPKKLQLFFDLCYKRTLEKIDINASEIILQSKEGRELVHDFCIAFDSYVKTKDRYPFYDAKFVSFIKQTKENEAYTCNQSKLVSYKNMFNAHKDLAHAAHALGDFLNKNEPEKKLKDHIFRKLIDGKYLVNRIILEDAGFQEQSKDNPMQKGDNTDTRNGESVESFFSRVAQQ